MTDNQKHLVERLIKGTHYLVQQPNYHKRMAYKLFEGNHNPVTWIQPKTIKLLKVYFKTDKRGRISINLNLVRQAHGRSTIKQLYKTLKPAANEKLLPNSRNHHSRNHSHEEQHGPG